jgi:DnaJ family protein C protein 7
VGGREGIQTREKTFNLAVEAHAVLSDSRRRQRYDMGEDENGMSEAGMGPGEPNLAEPSAQFHGGGRASFGGR